MGKWFAKDTGGDVDAVCQVRITLSNAAWTLAVAGSIMTGNGTPATSAPDRVVAAHFWHSPRAAATFMGRRLAGMETVAREPERPYAIDLVHKVMGFKGLPSPGRIEVRTALIITALVRTAQLEPARERVRAHLAGRPDELGLLGFEAFSAAGDAATAGAAPAQLAPLAGAPVPPAPLTRPASTAPPAPMAMAPPPRASTAPLVEVAPHCSATPRERLSGGASVIAPPASTPQPAHQRLATPPATPSPDALPISDAAAAVLSSRRAPPLEAAAFSRASTASPDAYAVAARTASSALAAGTAMARGRAAASANDPSLLSGFPFQGSGGRAAPPDAFPRAASPSSPSASVARRVAAAPQQHTDAALAALTETELLRLMAARGVGPPDEALMDASTFEEMLRRDLAAEGGAEEKVEERTERHRRIAAGVWRLTRCSGTEAALDAEFKTDYGRADLCLASLNTIYRWGSSEAREAHYLETQRAALVDALVRAGAATRVSLRDAGADAAAAAAVAYLRRSRPSSVPEAQSTNVWASLKDALDLLGASLSSEASCVGGDIDLVRLMRRARDAVTRIAREDFLFGKECAALVRALVRADAAAYDSLLRGAGVDAVVAAADAHLSALLPSSSVVIIRDSRVLGRERRGPVPEPPTTDVWASLRRTLYLLREPLPPVWQGHDHEILTTRLLRAARAAVVRFAPPPPPTRVVVTIGVTIDTRRIGDASWRRFALQKDAAKAFGIAESEVSHLVNDRSKATKKSLLFEARLVTVVSSRKRIQKRRREAPVAAAPPRQSSRVRTAVTPFEVPEDSPRAVSQKRFPCPAGCDRFFTHAPAAVQHGKTCAAKQKAAREISKD